MDELMKSSVDVCLKFMRLEIEELGYENASSTVYEPILKG